MPPETVKSIEPSDAPLQLTFVSKPFSKSHPSKEVEKLRVIGGGAVISKFNSSSKQAFSSEAVKEYIPSPIFKRSSVVAPLSQEYVYVPVPPVTVISINPSELLEPLKPKPLYELDK